MNDLFLFFLASLLILFPFVFRFVETRKFIRSVKALCNHYDMMMLVENPERIIDILEDRSKEWSAFEFLLANGPSPWYIYFSFKPLYMQYFYPEAELSKFINQLESDY